MRDDLKVIAIEDVYVRDVSGLSIGLENDKKRSFSFVDRMLFLVKFTTSNLGCI